MLIAEPTKFGAELILRGEIADLDDLRDTIYKLSDATHLQSDAQEFLLGLAYDVRKATEGLNVEEEEDGGQGEKTGFGECQILWPIVIPQVGMLRGAAGYMDTTKADQANLFRLEFCVESALMALDQNVGRECSGLMRPFQHLPGDYLFYFAEDSAMKFVRDWRTLKERLRVLPSVLKAMSPYSTEYRAFCEELKHIAAEKGCSPHELHAEHEDFDFKW